MARTRTESDTGAEPWAGTAAPDTTTTRGPGPARAPGAGGTAVSGVPAQPSPSTGFPPGPVRAKGGGGAADGSPGAAVRGEHDHAEPPVPRVPRRHSVRGQVLAALREALLDGDLVPGRIYSAPVLAERFGVSPTPVREAMQQLAAEGAVETVPNRGFRVAECSVRDIAELSEVRALLEIPSLLRLARTLPAERWRSLRPLAQATVALAARGERAAYLEADRDFHRALLELTGNRHLVRVTEEVRRRSRRAPRPTGDLLTAAGEHVALVDALAARDLVAVEELLRGHGPH
ncbi:MULTISPECIES: GntR family transcriptional regulator [unclassified Streptomyces]|uniref:GntR family transcriptional regulator n=1 Tax=unclassified Streptomyces TaxID=2593676 RepID=UPI0022B699D7|nr:MULTISPECIES: GntR family transcriptional regulator [unclassified Streptomyces]MCZ7415932.1 GntR family transcriptional regulator [Streptomyces sp. WMMC897]MCZ7434259.1 GntR family transcriptional regulator [Streptomyces sp. WMMC1477]